MSEEDYIALIYKSVKGALSAEETVALDSHTALSEENKILRAEIEDTWLFSQDNSDIVDGLDVEKDLLIISQKISASSDEAPTKSTVTSHSDTKTTNKSRRLNLRRLAMAASFLLLAVAAFLLTDIGDTLEESVYASDNKTRKVDLADGSTVVLNKDSYLHVPVSFSKSNRKVELQGEAFFEVASRKAYPFEIITGESIVTVLGTSFNVKTTKDNCIVGVISGKVRLEDAEGTHKVLLKKDEVGTHTYEDDSVVKRQVPADNMNYWKRENVVFKSISVRSVISQLSLMYGVDIQLENDDISECKVSLVSNEITIDKVLEKVCLSLSAQMATIDNETFVIKNGTCK